MMVASLLLAAAAFACLVLGLATGVGAWYIAVIVCAGLGLVLWIVDWARKHRR